MQIHRLAIILGTGLAGLAAGCSDSDDFSVNDCKAVTGTCMQFAAGADTELQTAANSIDASTTIILGAGTFKMSNQLTIRTAGVHVIGQGMDKTTLDFGKVTNQSNGVDAIGDGFVIQDVTVLDAPKDGIRVEATNGITFRRIRATWTAASNSNNGAYGIYPVKSQNVLVTDSVAENASDAGLYVGQCQHVIVTNNTVTGNVAGLEIENTEYADVYNNTATDNTGGIVVFDLPGNPIVGRDIRLRDNMIHDNNHVNFASGGTVASIPVGTGTFAMASRRVEITGNTYANNNTGDIALISGLDLESDITKWTLPTATIVGTYADLGLIVPAAGTIANFRSENILVSGNHHTGSGTMADIDDPLHLGALLRAVYAGAPVDSVIYDATMETGWDATVVATNTNDNHMCVGGNTGGTFASLNLPGHQVNPSLAFFRPAAPFAPFNCTTLAGGAVAEVVLPQGL